MDDLHNIWMPVLKCSVWQMRKKTSTWYLVVAPAFEVNVVDYYAGEGWRMRVTSRTIDHGTWFSYDTIEEYPP